jgi:hypothetical protein
VPTFGYYCESSALCRQWRTPIELLIESHVRRLRRLLEGNSCVWCDPYLSGPPKIRLGANRFWQIARQRWA